MSVVATPTATRQSTSLASHLTGRLSDLLSMTRPRIGVMTAVTSLVGYVLASPVTFDRANAVISVIGIVLLAAASSVLNQAMERGTDARMSRTSDRPLPAGRLSTAEAVGFGLMLCVSGAVLLWVFVPRIAAVAGMLTLLNYVCLYTPLKSRSVLCTTVGAVPGAMPPVLGWLCAGGELNAAALSLFAVFFVWQFPHFLAIGWLYRDQYRLAGLKMLPSFSDNGRSTGWLAFVYATAFIPVAVLPRFVGLAGSWFLLVAVILSTVYFVQTARFALHRTRASARRLLLTSLLVLPGLCVALAVDFLRLTSP